MKTSHIQKYIIIDKFYNNYRGVLVGINNDHLSIEITRKDFKCRSCGKIVVISLNDIENVIEGRIKIFKTNKIL